MDAPLTANYRTGENISVAAETVGAAIGRLGTQRPDEFGPEHTAAVAAAYGRAEAILKGLLMNLVAYGNGHGVDELQRRIPPD